MENTFTRAEELISHVKEYVNNRVDSIKLSAAEKSSKLIANLIAMMVVSIVLLIFVLFASVSLAYAFAKWTGEIYWGFLIVGGIYLFIGIVIWNLKERILRMPIMNAI